MVLELTFLVLIASAKGLFDRITIYPEQFPKWWRRSNYDNWPTWKKLLPFIGDGWHMAGWIIFFLYWLFVQHHFGWKYIELKYWHIHAVYTVFIWGYHDLVLKGKFNV